MTQPRPIRKQQLPPDFMSVDEFAVLIGFHRDFVCKQIRVEEMPGYKHGGHYRIPRRAVERYLRGEWRSPAKGRKATILQRVAHRDPKSLIVRR